MTNSIRPFRTRIQVVASIFLLQLNMAFAVEPPSTAASVQTAQAAAAPAQAPAVQVPFNEMLRHSHNPFDAYRGKIVAPPSLANSPRLDSLVRDGKLYLSLRDAIDLALENNLDLVIARYNLPIAQMDILRTSAGGSVRGVNTGVVSGTPGGAGVAGASQEVAAVARVARQAVRAEPGPAHRASFRPRWARALRLTTTIPSSPRRPMSITRRRPCPTR